MCSENVVNVRLDLHFSGQRSSMEEVAYPLTLKLISEYPHNILVAGEFSYNPKDPYAVALHMDAGTSRRVSWIFARSLLAEGVVSPVGEGDVYVAPHPDGKGKYVHISLTSPHGHALLQAETGDVVSFLTDSYLRVIPGTETTRIDIDKELLLLLPFRTESGLL